MLINANHIPFLLLIGWLGLPTMASSDEPRTMSSTESLSDEAGRLKQFPVLWEDRWSTTYRTGPARRQSVSKFQTGEASITVDQLADEWLHFDPVERGSFFRNIRFADTNTLVSVLRFQMKHGVEDDWRITPVEMIRGLPGEEGFSFVTNIYFQVDFGLGLSYVQAIRDYGLSTEKGVASDVIKRRLDSILEFIRKTNLRADADQNGVYTEAFNSLATLIRLEVPASRLENEYDFLFSRTADDDSMPHYIPFLRKRIRELFETARQKESGHE